MYLPRNHADQSDYPAGSEIREQDWHILAGFWHPVAFSTEVTDKPHAATLLDIGLVIFRTKNGVTVARDQCPHRGARLSLGWIEEGGRNIVCPFHGHHYDGTGACTWIPSLPAGKQAIPRGMRLDSFHAEEKYGLIWTCLKPEPLRPLPDWPLLGEIGKGWLRIDIPKGRWQTSASRHCENFNDIAHISWVHMKTFGNRGRPQVPDYKLERTPYGLHMELPYVEVERGFNDDSLGEREVYYTHDLTYPFATDLRVDYAADMTSHFFDIGSPVSARVTDIYQVTLTNIPGATAQDYADYQLVTNSEDVPVVESQRPFAVPLNLAGEVSIPADRLSMQYRRDLVEMFGLGRD